MEIKEDKPENRIDHMTYLPDMEVLESDVQRKVIERMEQYDYDKYTAKDVKAALSHEVCTVEDFEALLSPAALPYLEEMAQRAQKETRKHFGNSIYMFTPLYIANYCENYCIYCGFNCHNKIRRAKLNDEQIEKEMQAIAKTGLQEILILTGESKKMSDVEYIGRACQIARKYFKVIGLEVYPMNSDEYAYLHQCGADYVTVFQETYNSDKYETLHRAGHKRIFPYRLNDLTDQFFVEAVAVQKLLILNSKPAIFTDKCHIVLYRRKKIPHIGILSAAGCHKEDSHFFQFLYQRKYLFRQRLSSTDEQRSIQITGNHLNHAASPHK